MISEARIVEVAERAIRRRGDDPKTLDRSCYEDMLDRATFWLGVIEDASTKSNTVPVKEYEPAYRTARVKLDKSRLK